MFVDDLDRRFPGVRPGGRAQRLAPGDQRQASVSASFDAGDVLVPERVLSRPPFLDHQVWKGVALTDSTQEYATVRPCEKKA